MCCLGVKQGNCQRRCYSRLVDILRRQQAMRGAPHVTYLQNERLSNSLLDIQVVIVVVGIAKILAYRKQVIDLVAAISCKACAPCRRKNWLPGSDHAVAVSWPHGTDRARSSWISLKTIGRAVRWPVVQKGIQVRRIEIQAETRANDHVPVLSRFVCKSHPRREVLVVLGIHGIDSRALKHQSALARDEH